jgi:amino acid transporter
MGTVIISGILFALVSYAEVLGYGLDHVRALAQAESPLSQLSNRFVFRQFAMFIDLATAISAFACTIGSLSAAARILYVLGRTGAASGLGVLHHKQGTPARALLIVGAGNVIPILVFGAQAGATSYSGNLVTIGTLSLILVYIVVAGADVIEALRNRRIFSSVVGFTGAALLLWPLWNSFYPVPRWPGNLWPYVVMTWVVLGGLQAFLLRRKLMCESLD